MNNISLSDIGLPNRVPPRSLELRQSDYESLFDFETFAYDVFWRQGKIVFLCAPVPDESYPQIINTIRIKNKALRELPHRIYSNKIQKIIIDSDSNVISIGGREIVLDRVPDSYAGRSKVLYTLQKDNSIQWIRDWIEWHKKSHGIDAVIIYDNQSTEYSIETLARELQCPDLEVVIESCPFKYGPGAYKGSKWDSDFLQYAMFERLRYKDCNSNTRLLNADIDEMVVCKGTVEVFDLVSEDASACLFPGRWIEVPRTADLDQMADIRHESHTHVDISSYCANKWAVNLTNLSNSVFLRVHDFFGPIKRVLAGNSVVYLHHRQINTNWKYNRRKFIEERSEGYVELDNYKNYFLLID